MVCLAPGGPTSASSGPTGCFGQAGPTGETGSPTAPSGPTGPVAVRPIPRDRAQFVSGFERKKSIPVDSSDRNAQKSQG